MKFCSHLLLTINTVYERHSLFTGVTIIYNDIDKERMWVDNIKMDFKEIGWDGLD
jgi:hypothetical protein